MKKFILAILVVVFAAGTVNTPAHADNPALVPFLANWTPQPGGYTVVLVNYDSSYQWTFTPSTGQYYFDGQHQITVTGALGGFPSTLTVTTNKSGYATGTAKITGNVIGLPWNYTPSIQAGSQSATGFTAQITNYDSSKIWQWSAIYSYSQRIADRIHDKYGFLYWIIDCSAIKSHSSNWVCDNK